MGLQLSPRASCSTNSAVTAYIQPETGRGLPKSFQYTVRKPPDGNAPARLLQGGMQGIYSWGAKSTSWQGRGWKTGRKASPGSSTSSVVPVEHTGQWGISPRRRHLQGGVAKQHGDRRGSGLRGPQTKGMKGMGLFIFSSLASLPGQIYKERGYRRSARLNRVAPRPMRLHGRH